MLGLIGKKVGMTQVFDAQGKLIPVTVIKVEDNVVIANRTDDKNGYSAAVVATGEIKKSQTTKPYAGQFKDVCEPKKVVMEMRDFDNEVSVGDKLGVAVIDLSSGLCACSSDTAVSCFVSDGMVN